MANLAILNPVRTNLDCNLETRSRQVNGTGWLGKVNLYEKGIKLKLSGNEVYYTA